ncbi:hypothetical protein H6G89_17130 [Oscillatoria sp. FACHB-1407]|nr:hypothetical protein [Oscillatoria sp. FACHB-1407]
MVNRLFEHIPPEVATTFTPLQLEALNQASYHLTWKTHAVDIRWSIPSPVRFYLVLLAGREQRSPQRRLAERRQRPVWKPANIAVITTAIAVLALSTVGIQKFVLPTIAAMQSTQSHPTGIPWLQTKTECQNTGRVWKDGTCWDREHDASF